MRLCERVSELSGEWRAPPAVLQQLADATELARLEVTNLPEVPPLPPFMYPPSPA